MLLSPLDVTTRAVTVSGAEILQLKNLAIIAKALADQFGPDDRQAARQLMDLVRNLVAVTNKLEGLV